jgi:hypothetical protein
MLRCAAWRTVDSEFAARRLGRDVDDLLPMTIGYAALGAAMAAFSRWVNHPAEGPEQNLENAYAATACGFAE